MFPTVSPTGPHCPMPAIKEALPVALPAVCPIETLISYCSTAKGAAAPQKERLFKPTKPSRNFLSIHC